jgi:hypothetical protein
MAATQVGKFRLNKHFCSWYKIWFKRLWRLGLAKQENPNLRNEFVKE